MKLVILDRDGVVNKEIGEYVKSPEEFEMIPKSADAIAFLNQYDYTVVIASNQAGIARGLYGTHELNEVNKKMNKAVQQAGGEIAGIWFCPHKAEDLCECRKPKSGLIKDILDRFGAKAEDTYLVGDSLRDLKAIDDVGGKPILVLTGHGSTTLSTKEDEVPENTMVFEDLWEFSQWLCIESEAALKGGKQEKEA